MHDLFGDPRGAISAVGEGWQRIKMPCRVARSALMALAAAKGIKCRVEGEHVVFLFCSACRARAFYELTRDFGISFNARLYEDLVRLFAELEAVVPGDVRQFIRELKNRKPNGDSASADECEHGGRAPSPWDICPIGSSIEIAGQSCKVVARRYAVATVETADGGWRNVVIGKLPND